ncbi:MAG: Ammonia channel precursor [Verrucomicrobiota bacterium]|jgi:Amt family ammonium transporter
MPNLPRLFRTFTMLFALGVAAALAAVAQPAGAPTPTPAAAPTPKDAELIQSVGAYFQNGDPSAAFAAYKDKAGNLPPGFSAPTLGVAGPGHNAWMMVSAALVIFMTLPGLALFYGGLVRTKNVLSVAAWCFGITSLVTVLWWAVGYSLVFGKNFNSPFLGGSEFFFLRGVGAAPNGDYSFWVSHSVFAMYQLAFAIITPAVVIGSVVERMKFSAVLAVVALWLLVVYCPLAHMVWGSNGLMNGAANAGAAIKAIDFAGGMVVEMASGYSALILCLLVGKRHGFGKTPMPPHSLVFCVTGTGLLWVGWYGFNAGSAVAADGIAANAFMTTTLAAAVAAGAWAALEYFMRGKASVLGFCSGAVAGLVAITPACGFVDANGAIITGLLGGAVPFFACTKIKGWLGYDDALDVFGVHGVGGTVGLICTGVFATTAANPNLANNLGALVGRGLWLEQLKGIGLTLVWVTAGTAVVAFVVRAAMGLRAPLEAEHEGLDLAEHGEEGYIFEGKS